MTKLYVLYFRAKDFAKDFLTRKREEGATMAEYALLLGLIALTLITTIGLFKDSIIAVFTKATSTMNTAAGS